MGQSIRKSNITFLMQGDEFFICLRPNRFVWKWAVIFPAKTKQDNKTYNIPSPY